MGRKWTTRGDETSCELTGTMGKQKVTDTIPLPEHLGERGVAVIRPGGRRGARRRRRRRVEVGRGRGLTTLRKDRRVTVRG